MKAVLDTCVIYPTVMRQMLLGVATQGIFEPLWSRRIVEEWLRAAQKLGPEGVAQAQSEATFLKLNWPDAEVDWPASLEERLWLPDAADIHVLAAAVASSADMILTVNAKDFPRNILAKEGVSRADPDSFLMNVFEAQPDAVEYTAQTVLVEARRISNEDWTIRALLKKARLPRLGKALANVT
ncbi:MAG: PIN domain-containing protein [Pseudomonadota bacterium]